MRSRFGTAGRLLVVATTGTMLLSSCFWGSEDEPDAERRSTGPPRSAGPCKDANPAPPVTPDLNPAECRWWASAEDVVGFDDLVIITEEKQPGRFTMSAIRAETGQPLWTTPPIEAVADRAKGGERALQVVHWQGKPYAAFQHQTGKGSAVTFVPLSRDGDRTPVTWSASETDSEVPHALAARDDVSAAVVVGVVPQPWDVIDPTSGTTTRLPTSASEAVQAVGDGWFAEGNVDGFTFTIKRYDGSLAWDPATVVPEGANPTGSRDVIAAYGDYLLARWIKAADPGTPGTGAGSWLLAVHGKDGKPVATTEFGAFGDEDPTDETTTEPADRMVVSSNQRWLAVHSGKNTAAIDLTGGKAVTLEPGLLPFSVTVGWSLSGLSTVTWCPRSSRSTSGTANRPCSRSARDCATSRAG